MDDGFDCKRDILRDWMYRSTQGRGLHDFGQKYSTAISGCRVVDRENRKTDTET